MKNTKKTNNRCKKSDLNEIVKLLQQWVEFGNGHLYAPPQIESEQILKNLGVEFREAETSK